MKNLKDLVSKEKTIYNVYSDNGNDTTKTTCEGNSIVIPTLLSYGDDRMSHGGYVVNDFKGNKYVIGDENKTVNTNYQLSKIDLAHKLTCLVAIHHLVPNGAEVNLFIGLPIHSFYNLEYRQEYVDYFNEGKVVLTVNNIKKTFTINHVQAMPEGVGYVFTHDTPNLVAIVDIGHLTVDGAIYRDCTPILSTVFTTTQGANHLKTFVRDELNSRLLLSIKDFQMNEIMTNGLYGSRKEEADTIINECKYEYIKMVANEMLTHGWEIETLPIVFSGGGSILLEDVIDNFATFSLSDEPLFDNMKGFSELGVLVYD